MVFNRFCILFCFWYNLVINFLRMIIGEVGGLIKLLGGIMVLVDGKLGMGGMEDILEKLVGVMK